MPFKNTNYNTLLKYSTSWIILFIIIGGIHAGLEIYFINNFIKTKELIWIILYGFSILSTLLIIFFIRSISFKISCEYIYNKSHKKREIFLRSLNKLNEHTTVYRERIARDIYVPIFTFSSKALLLLISGIYIYLLYFDYIYSYWYVIVCYVGIFIICNKLFKYLSKNLKINLNILNNIILDLNKNYDLNYRSSITSKCKNKIKKYNFRLAKYEGYIDSVCQIPRYSFELILLAVLYTYTNQDYDNDLNASITASPILLRFFSSFQLLVKSYGHLRSNAFLLNDETKNISTSNKTSILIDVHKTHTNIVSSTKNINIKGNILSLNARSGFGKTNALINLEHNLNFKPLPTQIKIKSVLKFGIISDDPQPILIDHKLDLIEIKLKEIFGESNKFTINNNKNNSFGEKFRLSVTETILNGSELILIDESISSIQKDIITNFLKYVKDKNLKLIYFSHVESLHEQADNFVDLNEYV